jgi:hypothetical protein
MAVNTPTVFARGAFATSSATLYTVPASTTIIITNIAITNGAASAATFTLVLDGVDLFKTVAIAANTTVVVDMKQVLGTTKVITGLASAVTVGYHISGVASV